MDKKINQLHSIIKNFLLDVIDANTFEKEFTDIYDFNDLHPNNLDEKYFSKVREFLERFSSSSIDVEQHPEYYIDAKELKKEISRITE